MEALERSANGPKWEPKGTIWPTITDPEEIRKRFGKENVYHISCTVSAFLVAQLGKTSFLLPKRAQ